MQVRLGPERVSFERKRILLGSEPTKVVAALAWLAGIIDGDGCITFIRQKTKGNPPNYVPHVEIATSYKIGIEGLRGALHFLGKPFHISGPWGKSKLMFVRISGLKRVARLLIDLYPFLVIKQEEARLVLLFIGSRLGSLTQGSIAKGGTGNGYPPYTPEELELIEKVYQAKRTSNPRDRTPNTLWSEDTIRTPSKDGEVAEMTTRRLRKIIKRRVGY